MASTTLKSLESVTTPLELGCIGVDDTGSLTQRPPAVVRFDFAYGGIPFAAEVERTVSGGRLRLRARLGYRPYSAENRQRRIDIDHIIQATRDADEGRLIVAENQDVFFDGALDIEYPLTPVAVIAAATELVLRSASLVDFGRVLSSIPRATTTH